jgi:ubiquinone/menaquinone biosynthesis C-methylase UbiE
VELIQHNIDIFKGNITPDINITVRKGNAIDLSFIEDNVYDITLLLGPMYHLFTENDKIKALSEAIRVTKKGGVLFSAYCISDGSIICYGFRQGNIDRLVNKGLLDIETFKAFSTPAEIFELYRKEDIDELMKRFEVSRLHYVATDLATNYMRDTIDSMDDETFKIYLKYHFSICERSDMVGATHHSLDIVRKS